MRLRLRRYAVPRCRFDLTLGMPLPTKAALDMYLQRRLRELGVASAEAPALEEGASYADAERLVLDLARRTIVRTAWPHRKDSTTHPI